MKGKSIFISALIINIISGCVRQSKVIPSDNIKTVEIQTFNHVSSFKIVSDQNEIGKMMRELNKGELDPAVFKTTYLLKITYTDKDERLVVCNGHRIKVNGLTYKLNKSMDEIVGSRYLSY
ncbi:hypothetical protein [Mucilaginibacter sp.]|uniref:hypothetical protein n=1 Tax=Mucilaginibacter sp. TaxID=1882438 RepID=UPI0025E8B0E0|nr:hypothetical protein [Mucilaginibacter sp.]